MCLLPVYFLSIIILQAPLCETALTKNCSPNQHLEITEMFTNNSAFFYLIATSLTNIKSIQKEPMKMHMYVFNWV